MGVMQPLLTLLFGDGRNVIRDTAEVFRVNAEAQAGRDATAQSAALRQFGKEFALPRKGRFDRFMDALNRVPRPALAFGTIGLFVTAMADPVWFAARMAGIALVPEPLWWLLGAIVSFYFGARHQAKGQAFQQDLAQSLAAAPEVVNMIRSIESLRDGETGPTETGTNPALADWKRSGATM
jgi:hypothetical protein